jgi:uncharacterized protein
MRLRHVMIMVVVALSTFAAGCAALYGPDQFFESEGARLEYEIMVPTGGAELKPAVVFAVGSGTSGYQNYAPGFREELIESIFLPRDYAIYYFNKRGVGDSTGNWKWGSIEEQATDVLAAVDHLRSTPGIDPDRIGIIGHSQGGWVVQLAGSLDPDVDFVISLSGPTVSVREQDSYRAENDLRCEGASEEEIELELAKLNAKHERNISVGGWFPFFELRLAANLYRYDPTAAIQGLTQPTLLAFAGFDSMVHNARNLARFEEQFPDGTPSNITIHSVPGTDHMFRAAESTCWDYYDAIGNPYSEDFQTYMAAWVDAL